EQFLEGGTTQTFRYRPIQPGNYTLFGDISSGEGAQHLQRTFRFEVKTRDKVPPVTDTSTSGSGAQLVTTEPRMQADGSVTMPTSQELLKLTPLNTDLKNIALDTDTQVDSDGDGNPANDVQNTNTFFQSDSTPIYL